MRMVSRQAWRIEALERAKGKRMTAQHGGHSGTPAIDCAMQGVGKQVVEREVSYEVPTP